MSPEKPISVFPSQTTHFATSSIFSDVVAINISLGFAFLSLLNVSSSVKENVLSVEILYFV